MSFDALRIHGNGDMRWLYVVAIAPWTPPDATARAMAPSGLGPTRILGIGFVFELIDDTGNRLEQVFLVPCGKVGVAGDRFCVEQVEQCFTLSILIVEAVGNQEKRRLPSLSCSMIREVSRILSNASSRV